MAGPSSAGSETANALNIAMGFMGSCSSWTGHLPLNP
jgi:hypothetical protein